MLLLFISYKKIRFSKRRTSVLLSKKIFFIIAIYCRFFSSLRKVNYSLESNTRGQVNVFPGRGSFSEDDNKKML